MQTPTERPADSAGELYSRTPVTPEEAFQAIGRLRKEARDAIDQLIRFLDKTDDYVSRELEDNVDDGPIDDNELDGPEHEDDEDGNDDEPSLGSGATGQHSSQAQWSVKGDGVIDAEGEHDGAEPDEADCEPSAGYDTGEPSLGWTVDGELGFNEHLGDGADREMAVEARPPQNRTAIAQATVEVEVSHRRFLKGLTPDQQAKMRDRRRGQHSVGGVIL